MCRCRHICPEVSVFHLACLLNSLAETTDPLERRPLPITQIPLGRTHASHGKPAAFVVRPVSRPFADINLEPRSGTHIPLPQRSIRTARRITRSRLLQLDSPICPGLTESAFQSLFTRCVCGLIMMGATVRFHHCSDDQSSSDTEVIEITDSDND